MKGPYETCPEYFALFYFNEVCQKAVRNYRHFIFVLLIKTYISLNRPENDLKRKQSLI